MIFKSFDYNALIRRGILDKKNSNYINPIKQKFVRCFFFELYRKVLIYRYELPWYIYINALKKFIDNISMPIKQYDEHWAYIHDSPFL